LFGRASCKAIHQGQPFPEESAGQTSPTTGRRCTVALVWGFSSQEV
jgi:hypothetical protein